MQVDRFSARFEATPRQSSYIAVLCKQTGQNLEEVLVHLWGMSLSAAFSDRPWMRLSRREASNVIDHLLKVKGQAKPARQEPVVDSTFEPEPNSVLIEEVPF